MESAAQQLTAVELSADRQDFSVHTAGTVTGFILNAGAVGTSGGIVSAD